MRPIVAGGPVSLVDYRTRFLRPEQWRRARPAVEQAMTALAASGVDSQLAPLLSVLCRFLADSPWDRRSPITWSTLLTEVTINTVCADWTPVLAPSTVASYRGGLRRVADVLGVEAAARVPIRPVWVPTEVTWWWHRRGCGPFSALAAAWASTGGKTHPTVFNGIGAVMRAEGAQVTDSVVSGVCPPQTEVTGTVDVDPSVAWWLQAAADVDWEVVLPDTPRTATGGAPPRGRGGVARMAQLRRAARTSNDSPRLAELPQLPPEVAASIACYVPKKIPTGVWQRVETAARAAMTAFGPASPRWVSTHGGYVVRFCVWLAARIRADEPLAPEALLTPGLVDRYILEGLDAPDSTVATARWVLRRAVQRLSASPYPQQLAHRAVRPPYTPAECAALVRVARAQPTAAKRRALSAAVALGLGAGLDGRDQRLVTRSDVTTIDVDGTEGLVVQVRGSRPRTVVVRAAYVPLLVEACALHTEEGRDAGELLHGRHPGRASTVAAVSAAAVTASGPGVEVSAARMRTTWLLAVMCSPVPLSVLLAAAGLTTARTLTELLPYCPAPDPADVARILAAADNPALGVGR